MSFHMKMQLVVSVNYLTMTQTTLANFLFLWRISITYGIYLSSEYFVNEGETSDLSSNYIPFRFLKRLRRLIMEYAKGTSLLIIFVSLFYLHSSIYIRLTSCKLDII